MVTKEMGKISHRSRIAKAGHRRQNSPRHRLHDTLQLITAHDRHARVRPLPQEPRVVSSTGHAVIASAVRTTDEDGEFRHGGGSDGADHLGAIFGDAALLGVFADHEAGNVDEEDEWDAALFAQLDKLSCFQSGGREDDAVVGNLCGRSRCNVRFDEMNQALSATYDADRVAVNMSCGREEHQHAH